MGGGTALRLLQAVAKGKTRRGNSGQHCNFCFRLTTLKETDSTSEAFLYSLDHNAEQQSQTSYIHINAFETNAAELYAPVLETSKTNGKASTPVPPDPS